MESNDISFVLLSFATLTLFSWIIIYLAGQKKFAVLEHENEHLKRDNQQLGEKLETASAALEIEKEKNHQLVKDYSVLDTKFTGLYDQFEQYKIDLSEQQEKFELLANKVLEEKSNRFDVQQRKGITDLLEPLKEKIKSFEEKVEATNKESVERNSALKQQIISLAQLNEKISTEAVNLTKALKGDHKKQGTWGEIILENILDKSGLEKGREYFVQKSIFSDENKRQQPDIIINTPDNKVYIIDSKVSLVAYERFTNAEDEEIAQYNLRAHCLSIKKHIDGLAAKRYHELYKIESPDFVLMFVPIDTAFSAAVKNNPELYNYAFEKNIVIVTPSTLLATLKTVETMWRNDKQQRFAVEIATEAGKMYDKFAGFVTDMEVIGKRIDQSKTAFDLSMRKLSLGSGNLMTKAQRLKSLGAKASKQLPKSATDFLEDDGAERNGVG